jgi:hypothetical protein
MNAQSLEHESQSGGGEQKFKTITALFWALTPHLLRDESFKSRIGCGVFENRVFRNISTRKSGEVRMQWEQTAQRMASGLLPHTKFY